MQIRENRIRLIGLSGQKRLSFWMGVFLLSDGRVYAKITILRAKKLSYEKI